MARPLTITGAKYQNCHAISLIALIITIIVIIILAAVVIGSSLSTPEKANYAKFMSDMSEIQQSVSIARTENLIGSVNTSESISKDAGFTKVIIKNAPGTFSSVNDGDNITGYIVNFDKLNINAPQGLTDTTGLTEVEFETDNLYIYDADGVVYRTKGYEENGVKYYAINDANRPWDGKTKNTNWYDKNPSATEFYINTANEFAGLGKIVNDIEGTYASEFFSGKTIYLNNDIDMGGRWTENENGTVTGTGTNYIAIGTKDNPFAGTFDGQYHEVSGIYSCNRAFNFNGKGLFRASTGVICNVGVDGYIQTPMMASGICAYNLGRISNCYNKAIVVGGGYYAGIASVNGFASGSGIIENCYNIGKLKYDKYSSVSDAVVGGICGRQYSGSTLKNCYNIGEVNGRSPTIGGITGFMFGRNSNYKLL